MNKIVFNKILIIAIVVCMLFSFVCCAFEQPNNDPPTDDPTDEPIDDPTDEPSGDPIDEPSDEPPTDDPSNDDPQEECDSTENCLMQKEEGKTIADYDAKQNLYIAAGVLDTAKNFRSDVSGKAVAGILTQQVASCRVVLNDICFKQSVSHSMIVKVGTQFFCTADKYILRTAKKISSVSSVTWEDNAESLSKTDFADKYGAISRNISGYVLNDFSIISATQKKKSGDNYVFEYCLDLNYAPQYLKYEMRTQSGMGSFPVFKSIVLTVCMSENWEIKQVDSKTSYKIGMYNCEETLKEVFSQIGNVVSVPNYDFFSAYLT